MNKSAFVLNRVPGPFQIAFLRHLRRLFHALQRHIRLPVGDIIPDRIVEEHGLLGHLTDLLAQTFDHRAVDGAYSAAFLREVKTALETRDWTQALKS